MLEKKTLFVQRVNGFGVKLNKRVDVLILFLKGLHLVSNLYILGIHSVFQGFVFLVL